LRVEFPFTRMPALDTYTPFHSKSTG
jgi:hypothetical protein